MFIDLTKEQLIKLAVGLDIELATSTGFVNWLKNWKGKARGRFNYRIISDFLSSYLHSRVPLLCDSPVHIYSAFFAKDFTGGDCNAICLEIAAPGGDRTYFFVKHLNSSEWQVILDTEYYSFGCAGEPSLVIPSSPIPWLRDCVRSLDDSETTETPKSAIAPKRGGDGKFAAKSDDTRRVRSVRVTDSSWEILGEMAHIRGMTRADLLEAIALLKRVPLDPQADEELTVEEYAKLFGEF
ncbi:MAG: hypothetical protein WBB28_01995 [Crinalium sp.]